MNEPIKPGTIVAIEEPRVEKVDPATRACTGSLQAFRVGENGTDLKPCEETPTVFLKLGQGVMLR